MLCWLAEKAIKKILKHYWKRLERWRIIFCFLNFKCLKCWTEFSDKPQKAQVAKINHKLRNGIEECSPIEQRVWVLSLFCFVASICEAFSTQIVAKETSFAGASAICDKNIFPRWRKRFIHYVIAVSRLSATHRFFIDSSKTNFMFGWTTIDRRDESPSDMIHKRRFVKIWRLCGRKTRRKDNKRAEN